MLRKRAVVFLSTPLTPIDGTLHLSERAHVQTLRLLSERFDDVAVVARCRSAAVLAMGEHVSLAETGARLAHELPDFGGGARALRSAMALLLSPARFQTLVELARPADLLYAEVPSLEGLLASRLARSVDKPYIIEMRGEGVLNPDYLRARIGWAGAVASHAVSAGFELARRGAMGALFVGEQLRERYGPAGAITAVASSVRLPPGTPRPARHFSTPATRFLFVGHLEKIKAIHVIIGAMAQLAGQLSIGWRLDIIGDGPERAALMAQAEVAGIIEHVHFHGRVPWGQELFRFYETADVLLMASLTEGNSRTLLEGMAFALPAVSTAVGEAPRHLRAEVLVPPGMLPPFVEAVRRLALSPTRLSAMSQHNAQQVAEYAPEALRRRRASFIDTILASPLVERHMEEIA